MTDEIDRSIRDEVMTLESNGSLWVLAEDYRALLARIEHLTKLVEIGDVRCEQCGDPATTLDEYGDPACQGCCDAGPEMEDTE